ncbi:MAG: hypothetical protein KKE30_05355 [Gammaproteobacteria bacterium]|nr:hypothetical protein [Gammaproteobacteria bacterium]MBU1556454.1 hypothetical protein [Gammaproteobacteria bacterium]MBU2070150.1 hypothetical protein [Gammaproteobacteria bacterium]MBU2181901.1 hypothetical protein [Gammaproteobacteria bacterium]MBU2205503.1 hypothetical protein [Gammaproteobacteria bacterium]
MNRDKQKDANAVAYSMMLILIITVWHTVSSLYAFTIGEVFEGKVSGAAHFFEDTTESFYYTVDLPKRVKVLATFEEPVMVGQKVFVFCTELVNKKGAECSGHAYKVNGLQVLLNEIKLIPLFVLFIYLINIYRKNLLKSVVIHD